MNAALSEIERLTAERDQLAFEKCSALAELGRACTKVTQLESDLALYRGLAEENRKFESIRNGDLVAALEDLVARCDGAEGVRADGSNIDTLRAHAALHGMPIEKGESRGQAVGGNAEGEVPNRAPATSATTLGSNLAPEGGGAFDIVDAMHSAQTIVEASLLWHRFIDGTPLSNDIACWMAEFARDAVQRYISSLPADWNEDSSIETWFPLSARELASAEAAAQNNWAAFVCATRERDKAMSMAQECASMLAFLDGAFSDQLKPNDREKLTALHRKLRDL